MVGRDRQPRLGRLPAVPGLARARATRRAYARMFLTLGGSFPTGATEEDLLRLYRPRPGLPFTPFTCSPTAPQRLVWTTFTPQQIDIDVRAPDDAGLPLRVLDRLAAAGSPRATGRGGLRGQDRRDCRSFMTPGDVRASSTSSPRGATTAGSRCSSRCTPTTSTRSRSPDRSTSSTTSPCRRWSCTRCTAATPTRSGAGWRCGRRTRSPCSTPTTASGSSTSAPTPATGPGRAAHRRADRRARRGDPRTQRRHLRPATGAAASNVDLYQVNCTFYDALGRDDDRYLLARAMQFLTPGIPQVYYVGLLAGTQRHGTAGAHQRRPRRQSPPLHRPEIERELRRPVVQALLRLIRFRNSHPAFEGAFSAAGGGPTPDHDVDPPQRPGTLDATLDTPSATLTWTEAGTRRTAPLHELPF